jgi:hypothetical protein
MEVVCSSETSVDFQRATRRHVPENNILQNICCYTAEERQSSESNGKFQLKYCASEANLDITWLSRVIVTLNSYSGNLWFKSRFGTPAVLKGFLGSTCYTSMKKKSEILKYLYVTIT